MTPEENRDQIFGGSVPEKKNYFLFLPRHLPQPLIENRHFVQPVFLRGCFQCCCLHLTFLTTDNDFGATDAATTGTTGTTTDTTGTATGTATGTTATGTTATGTAATGTAATGITATCHSKCVASTSISQSLVSLCLTPSWGRHRSIAPKAQSMSGTHRVPSRSKPLLTMAWKMT
jgi:hypothetical protein